MRRRVSLIVALWAATAALLVSAGAAPHRVEDTTLVAHTSVRATPAASTLLTHAKRAAASPRDGLRATAWLLTALCLLVVVAAVCLGDDGSLGLRRRARLALPARGPPAF